MKTTKNCSWIFTINSIKLGLQKIVVGLFLKRITALFFKLKLELQLFSEMLTKHKFTLLTLFTPFTRLQN